MASHGTANQILAQNGYQPGAPLPQVSGTTYAPTAVNTTAAQPALNAESGLLTTLQAQAAGTGGPSLAQQQLQTGTNANLAGTLAAATATGNQNPGAAKEAAGRNLAAINAGAAGTAAATKASEQLAAEQGVGQEAGTLAGQDLGVATTNAGATNTASQFGAAQAQQAGEFNTGLTAEQQAQYQNELGMLTNLNQNAYNQYQNTVNSPSTYLNVVGGAGQAIGSASSDEAVKTAISTENATTQGFLDALAKYATPGSAPELAPMAATQPQAMPKFGGSSAPSGTTQSADSLAASNAGSLSPMGAAPVDATTASLTNPDTASIGQQMGTTSGYGLSPGELTSDEAQKDSVTSDEEGKEKMLLDGMKGTAHGYEYKDPNAPGSAPGRHYGPMAQELEAAGPIGKSVVVQGPDGVKRVDTQRLTLALASGAGILNSRISALEEALKSGR